MCVPESSPRETNRASARGDPLQRGGRVRHAPDARRIGGRPEDHEVVPHHVAAIDAVPLGDERVLALAGVDEEQVGVAALPELEGLAGADRDDVDPDPVAASKGGSRRPSSPELSVLVVVASRIGAGGAGSDPQAATRPRPTRSSRTVRMA